MPSGLKVLQETNRTPKNTDIPIVRDGKLTNSSENQSLKSFLAKPVGTEIKLNSDYPCGGSKIEITKGDASSLVKRRYELPSWCDNSNELLPDIYEVIRTKEVK
jgi:hypothetical protein